MSALSPSQALAIKRTGPIGRLARLGLTGIFVATFLSIVSPRGSAQFRNPHILGEPLAWFLNLTMFVVFVFVVGALATAFGAGPRAARRWQVLAVATSAAGIAIAAAGGQIAHGAAWGFPLADLVWWFDVVVIVEQVVALLLAVALGTRGCEIGVWSVLLARLGRSTSTEVDALACIVGLHYLDEWEATRYTTVRG